MSWALLAGLLVCAAPEIQNHSGEPWTPYDIQLVSYYTRRCLADFDRSPCLSKFHKYPNQHYFVRCKAALPGGKKK